MRMYKSPRKKSQERKKKERKKKRLKKLEPKAKYVITANGEKIKYISCSIEMEIESEKNMY